MLHLLRMVSLRHLVGAPLRSGLTILGVAMGVATMVGVASINTSVLKAFRATVDTIAGKADLSISGTAAGFDDALTERVKALPGVLHASGGLTIIAPVQGAPGESLYVMGVDLLDDGFFRTYQAVDGDIGALADDLEFLNSTDRMLVSERFAGEHKLKVGDSFQLQTTEGWQPFFVHALIRETGPVKAFGGSVGVMYVGSAQEGFHRSRLIDRIDVAVDPKVGVEAMKASLEKELGGAFEVDRPSRRGGSVQNQVKSFQMGLNLASAVAVLVGVFLVYNTVSIGVIQRRREIGTLRALGGTRARIRTMFALEAVLMGIAGSAIGLPLGVAIARAAIRFVSDTVASIYVQVNATDVSIGPEELALGLAIGIAGSLFAALRPAVIASRVQPVEALRRDIAAGAEVGSYKSGPVLLGLVLLALVYPANLIPPPVENFPLGGYLSIFFTLFGTSLISPLLLRALQRVFQRPAEAVLGIAGRLAADNFTRAPARTAVPVSALSIGVAMTVCIGGFVGSFKHSSEEWIQQGVPADLFITSSAKIGGVRSTPMNPAFAEEIQKIPGVGLIDFVRIFPHDCLGLRVYIISLKPEVYYTRGVPTFLEGHAPTLEERAQGKVTVSENLSRRRNLHLGDTFPMLTPTGQKTYVVGAVIRDYTSDQGTVFMDRELFVEHFQDDRVDTFELYLDDLTKLESVRREVTARFGQKHDLYVLSNKELRDEAYNLVNGAFAVTYAMEAVAMLLALLGVINTLLAAVLDRTREIGLLRAVGAGRGHILRLFSGEAALIGLTGGLIGVAAGVVTGIIITRVVGVQSTGWAFPYLFPWELALQMVSAATVCALVAGLYPAHRAAGLDVVEALAYE
ncbi:MAG: ABC transporter permease [Myxococcaceae bacterium]